MTRKPTDSTSAYWKANLRLVALLLAIWAISSFGFSIFFAEPLNSVRLGGYKLGFFLAQQGSIYIFIALIFVYVRQMNRLDRKFRVDD